MNTPRPYTDDRTSVDQLRSHHPNITRRMSNSPPRKSGFTAPKATIQHEWMLAMDRREDTKDEDEQQVKQAYIQQPVSQGSSSFLRLPEVGSGYTEFAPLQPMLASAPPMPVEVPTVAPVVQPMSHVTPHPRRADGDNAVVLKQLVMEAVYEVMGNTPARGRVSFGGHGGGDGPSSSDDEDNGKDPPRKGSRTPLPGRGSSGSGGGRGGKGRSDPPDDGGGSSSSSESDSDKSMDSNSEIFKGISALRVNRRNASMLSSSVIADATPALARSVEALNLRPLPTKANLILKDFEIHNIMSFLKKFESLQQEFEQPLKMAVYFSDTM